MNLAKHLLERGDDVLAISRSPMKGPAFTLGLETNPRYRYLAEHINYRYDAIVAALDEFAPESIVNFAALCEVGNSWLHPLDYYHTNCIGLVRLVEEIRNRVWLRQFVQIASSEVYGSNHAPVSEDAPYNPSSPYAASKAVFDWHLRAVAKHQGFPAVLAMPSNGFCEGQSLNRIIPKTIIAARMGRRVPLQGGGRAMKSYLHADDISRAVMLIMEKGAIGHTYNIGPKAPTSIRQVMEVICVLLNKKFSDIAEIVPDRVGQDACYWLDSTKIESLGWKPQVGFSAGIRRVIEWIDANPSLLHASQDYIHRV